MAHKTIAQLANDLHTKQISSVELTQYFLDRIKRFDPQLNSFITVCESTALAEAKQADTLRTKRYFLHHGFKNQLRLKNVR
jgi:aspartyl-tRNA(Asn)/glutamyl-tRNA(Gln) amidotransferase subunit A